MGWSQQQDGALQAIKRWLNDKSGSQIFRLFGYAGSGKTTLAKEIAANVSGLVVFAAYTGKASLVLRKKGCDASTIHSLIYKAVEDPITGHVEFRLNQDSAVASASLVIIDEVSMVGEELARDLLSFGTRVLVLGDPAQLPPVNGEGFFINAKPDFMLTEIHRQAEENPIIRMSMMVREGASLPAGEYGESRVMSRRDIGMNSMQELVLGADQVLCGLNRTRQTFNSRIRDLKGIGGVNSATGAVYPYPVVGDRLVCLRNNRTKGLLNGGLWDVDRVSRSAGIIDMVVSSVDEPGGAAVDVSVPSEFFTGDESRLDWRFRRRHDEMTFGYVLTCHKGQGSQWPNVLIFDESRSFREDASKWLYTAITRAAERVTVIV